MKRIIPFFAVCLGLSVFQTASVIGAESIQNTTKRNSANVISATNSSTRSNPSTKQKTESNRTEKSRTTKTTTRTTQNTEQQTRTVANRQKSQTIKQRSSVPTNTKRVNVVSRTAVPQRSAETRNTKNATSRNAVSSKSATRSSVSRATQLNEAKITNIKSKDYSKCKTVYYECMDEFCANKDANLGRCACSARIHEFDNIKNQLTNVEDKMLDFNQKLLLVGLDKEDAAAVNVATEGESGFETKDSSKSEKLLKKITDALNSSSDSKITNNLSSLSLSLDMDSAWDSVDSISGISTSAKTGTALYNAARPVCIEMAHEVCSDDELDIAQNSYKLLIQQDCNTVSKSYKTQYNQAQNKIHESSALLDIARLDAHQQRNSDDILTCKRKILEQLSDSSVCGENLYKCLDITGQYINPSDGSAFLSANLYNITTLLTAPQGDETWSNVSQNKQFVTFLNSKKMFLEPAIEQCQDIADTVWKDFLNDALAQIKLAQNAKLEEIRQSCTTLVAECKNNAQKTLQDFDARALSTFQVMADSTANALCADVQQSCVSLINSSGGGATQWEEGMTGIAADISYDSILENCATVGRDCIIQQCNGTSGNFALCGNFSSGPRRAILNRSACWNEVLSCVQQSTNLDNIDADIVKNRKTYYNEIFGITDSSDYELIPAPCKNSTDTTACLITEQLWGNCENNISDTIISTNSELIGHYSTELYSQNKILIPQDGQFSLLYWLASNTGTTNNIDSCSTYKCPINYKYDKTSGSCLQLIPNGASSTTGDGKQIMTTDQQIYVTNSLTNYCAGGINSKDKYGNCCTGAVSDGICVPDSDYNALFIQDTYCDTSAELPDHDSQNNLIDPPAYYCADYTTKPIDDMPGVNAYVITDNKKLSLYCITTKNTVSVDSQGELTCEGYLVLIDQYGNYIPPIKVVLPENSTSYTYTVLAGPSMGYNDTQLNTCKYTYNVGDHKWRWLTNTNAECTEISNSANNNDYNPVPKDNRFTISY